jgi:hypothetical protein
VAGIALLTAIAIAACGGGGSASTTSTSSSASAAAATPPSTGASGATGGTGAFAARRQALETCLKKAGVTLPNRPFGATGASGRFRFGATGATGARGRDRFFGATGASGPRGRGFFGGGAGRGLLGGNSKLATAFRKCLSTVGGSGFGGTGRRPGFFVAQNSRQRQAIVAYAACMKTHGVTLPAPNFSRSGSVFGTTVNRNSTAFRDANASCLHLLTFLAPRGATGSSGPPAA